jgi:hypothetical protein
MKTLRILKVTLLWVCLIGLPIGFFWIGGRLNQLGIRGENIRLQGRFDQIELMLLMYHEDHGVFPPTNYQPVADGPIHSWRVLLVPYTSPYSKKGYSDYDFLQEWNSPHNSQVLSGKPSRYFRTKADDGDIANLLAIGKDDEWPSDRLLKSRLVRKGGDRYLLVEYPDSKIHWMEPKY